MIEELSDNHVLPSIVKESPVKNSTSMFLSVRSIDQMSRFSSSSLLYRKKHLIITLVMFLLCLPVVSRAFSFSSVADDVGNAVKSGASAVEDGVKQVFPGDDKNKKNQNEGASPQQAPAKPAPAAPAKSVTKAKQTGSTPSTPSNPSTSSTVPPPPDTTSAAVVTSTAVAAPKPSSGGTVFSKEPINPSAPPASLVSFAAGDKIYGMLKATKPWKELLGSSDYLIVYVSIDGTQKVSKTISLKRPDLLTRNYFIIDIAPDPSGMTNYSDRDIIFPEKDGFKFGPELFTKYLSELTPGKHSFRLEVKAYNEVFAAGEFSISGSDYSSYAALLADIKNSSGKQQKMPKPGMTNIALQNEMIALLKNAGWPEIRRLLIVDKDWWIDRVSGGDSPIQSRHIEAAAAAKDAGGSYYYSHVTFHQPMLITGAWGKMALTDTGKKKTITEENIDQ